MPRVDFLFPLSNFVTSKKTDFQNQDSKSFETFRKKNMQKFSFWKQDTCFFVENGITSCFYWMYSVTCVHISALLTRNNYIESHSWVHSWGNIVEYYVWGKFFILEDFFCDFIFDKEAKHSTHYYSIISPVLSKFREPCLVMRAKQNRVPGRRLNFGTCWGSIHLYIKIY